LLKPKGGQGRAATNPVKSREISKEIVFVGYMVHAINPGIIWLACYLRAAGENSRRRR